MYYYSKVKDNYTQSTKDYSVLISCTEIYFNIISFLLFLLSSTSLYFFFSYKNGHVR